MSQINEINENDINWLQNGEKAEAIVLNRPMKQLLQQTNSKIQEIESEIDSKIDSKVQEIESEIESEIDSKIDSKVQEIESEIDSKIDSKVQEIESVIESEIDSKIDSKVQEIDSKIQEIESEIQEGGGINSLKPNKPSILTTGTNLNWDTVFESSTFVSAPVGDTIKEAEYSLYDKDGLLIRTIIKTSDFYKVQFSSTDFIADTEYSLRVRHLGSYFWSEQSDPFDFKTDINFVNAYVYGVALIEEGGNGGTLVHIDEGGNPINLTKSDFDSHPVWGSMEDQIIDGQHMVRVPKFYHKVVKMPIAGYSGTKKCWFISGEPSPGFETYPAFFNAGEEVDQFWYGKYQAYVSGGKMGSVPGVLPTVDTSLTQFKALAEARNTAGVDGFMVLSWYQLSAIQWLYLIENATFDSQTKTGEGRVSASSVANVDASDVAQASYRGIVGLWGNVHQWIDGFQFDNKKVKVWDRLGNKTWVDTGLAPQTTGSNLYPVTFMENTGETFNLTDGFIGDTGPTSNANATAPDRQYYQTGGTYVPYVGGYWSHGSFAGLWFFFVNFTATYSYSSFGSRLAKV